MGRPCTRCSRSCVRREGRRRTRPACCSGKHRRTCQSLCGAGGTRPSRTATSFSTRTRFEQMRTASRGLVMAAIKRILCPVDFSEFSRHALDSAVAIARHEHAAVTALYVVPPPQAVYPPIGPAAYVPYDYTVEDLQEFQRTLERFVAAADYPVAAVAVEALVVDEILKRAADLAADLIVMGTHGRSGFDRLLLGS